MGNELNFAGSVVVITGAGSGLGRELARSFCGAGATVIGIGRDLAALQESGPGDGRSRYHPVALDVSDAARVVETVEGVVATHGRIDILFNNAAVYPRASFLEESMEDFRRALEINVVGVANMCKSVLPHMIRQRSGRVFNVGSWADRNPIAASAAYSASKGAVHALTRAIAVDIAPLGLDIEVHEWIPAHMNTRMSDYTGIDPAIPAQWALGIARCRHDDRLSRIYEGDREWEAPKGRVARLRARLASWMGR